MGIWDSLRRFAPQESRSRRVLDRGRRARKARHSKPRGLRIEQCEERTLLSINDPLFADQWNLFRDPDPCPLNATEVWDFANNSGLGTGVVIGVVDDGLQWNHPALSSNYRPNLSDDFTTDLVGGDTDPSPGVGDNRGT